jgi:hypothetical protein
MSSKSDNNLVTNINKAVTQEDITQLMDTAIRWMADPLNPNRDSNFRTKTKDVVDNIGGICNDIVGKEPLPLAQTLTIDKNTPVQITLKSTNPNNEYITFLTLTEPQFGKISDFDGITGNLTYTPNTDIDNVTDSFDFTINVNGVNSIKRSTVNIAIDVIVTPTPTPTPTPTCPELPTDGKPQPEKNGNANAKTWKVTKMVGSKYKGKYKVVDSLGINIAVEFKTTQTAQQYIDHFVCIQSGGGSVTPTPTPTPQPLITKSIISQPVSKIVKPNQHVELDGSKSTSVTPGQITFVWKVPGVPAVIFETVSDPVFKFNTTNQEGELPITLEIIDGDGGTSESTVTLTVTSVEPPQSDKDPEGIQKLYPDDPAQEKQQWFLSKYGPNDARVSGKGARKIISGNIVQITPDPGTNPASARIYIRTTNPNALDQNTQLINGKDWAKMAQQKYMVGPEDFRNCEVTHYYKITKSSASDEMTTYWMGGAHPSGDAFPLQCIACCNKAQIKMDMTPRAAKEYHHAFSPAGYAWSPTKALFDLKGALGGTMVGKMIGQKLVMYVIDNPDGTPKEVHLELYVDTQSKDLPKPDYTKQKWDLLAEWMDNGSNWPDPSNDMYIKNCNAKKGQMISWGGPYVALRLDDNIWELHALSIRPILIQK